MSEQVMEQDKFINNMKVLKASQEQLKTLYVGGTFYRKGNLYIVISLDYVSKKMALKRIKKLK